MREFVISALQAQKIARAKNECHDLAIMAKTVGSNYSLFNRQLRPDLKYPFAALSAEAPYVPQGKGAASAAPNSLTISKMVNPRGIEPLSTLYSGILHALLSETKYSKYYSIKPI